MNQDCWILNEEEGPRPNPGDIACWLQNVAPSNELNPEDGSACPEGKTCYEVPEGLRGPQPGDTMCWAGKGKSGPSPGTKAIWEAKRGPGPTDKITWEGRPAAMEEVYNVYSPKAGGNNKVWDHSKTSGRPSNAIIESFRPGRNEEVKAASEYPDAKTQIQPQSQPCSFLGMDRGPFVQMDPYSMAQCRPNSFNPNLMSRSISTMSSSSSASSSHGKFRFNNANFCNCKIPLPPWFKEKKRQKSSSKKTAPPPLCAVTCGNPKCAASKFTTQEFKCIPISKGYYEDPKPGICCYMYGQTVFNTSDKKNKTEDTNFNFSSHTCPTYSISTSRHHPFRQPQQVQLVKPVTKPAVDNDNDSFLLNISKKDHCGKPAKLNLSFKIPKTKITYRYDEESQFPEKPLRKGEKGGSAKGKKKSAKGKKGKKGAKGKKGKKGKSSGKKKKK